jgi:hypothetical protein
MSDLGLKRANLSRTSLNFRQSQFALAGLPKKRQAEEDVTQDVSCLKKFGVGSDVFGTERGPTGSGIHMST